MFRVHIAERLLEGGCLGGHCCSAEAIDDPKLSMNSNVAVDSRETAVDLVIGQVHGRTCANCNELQ
jgi:hypothetical protein